MDEVTSCDARRVPPPGVASYYAEGVTYEYSTLNRDVSQKADLIGRWVGGATGKLNINEANRLGAPVIILKNVIMPLLIFMRYAFAIAGFITVPQGE